MPAYDYVCLKCGQEFEVNQSIKDDPLQRCIVEGCDGEVKRRIGAGAGLIFKGSGFYATDYKSPTNGNGKKKEDAPSCPMAGSESGCGSCPNAGK